MLDKSIWENRHTARLFSTENTNIPLDDLKYLQTVINNIPSQCSIKTHFWVYLGQSKEDIELRTWLADNVFWVMQEEKETEFKEHMLGIIQAPAILLSIRTNKPWANITEPDNSDEYNEELAIRSEGFHAGVLLSTLLNMNYNVATFGCNSGYYDKDYDKKRDQFQKMIRERYADELRDLVSKYPGKKGNWDDIKFYPGLSTCFGPEAIDKQETGQMEIWTSPTGKKYHFVNGSKPRTPAESCIGFRRNYE
jgi:hypothetical protein